MCAETSGAAKPDERLGRSRRLIRSTAFDEAFSQGRKRVGRYMVLWVREGADASLRLGVVTSRKVGGAVQRVRARRVLRETFRRNRHRLKGAFDLVLVARANIVRAPSKAVVEEFLALAGSAGLME